MFSVIYTFQVQPNRFDSFLEGWRGLTKLIYKFEGSFGSRLHKKNDNTFIAYACWPNKETWKNSGNKLPEQANHFRKKMKEACDSIETNYELEVVEDLLKGNNFA